MRSNPTPGADNDDEEEEEEEEEAAAVRGLATPPPLPRPVLDAPATRRLITSTPLLIRTPSAAPARLVARITCTLKGLLSAFAGAAATSTSAKIESSLLRKLCSSSMLVPLGDVGSRALPPLPPAPVPPPALAPGLFHWISCSDIRQLCPRCSAPVEDEREKVTLFWLFETCLDSDDCRRNDDGGSGGDAKPPFMVSRSEKERRRVSLDP